MMMMMMIQPITWHNYSYLAESCQTLISLTPNTRCIRSLA